jgi:hypothetical protein
MAVVILRMFLDGTWPVTWRCLCSAGWMVAAGMAAGHIEWCHMLALVYCSRSWVLLVLPHATMWLVVAGGAMPVHGAGHRMLHCRQWPAYLPSFHHCRAGGMNL